MTYYRLAFQERQTGTWIWKSTALTSLDAVLRLLRLYRFVRPECMRVFTSASKEDLHEMLSRENKGLGTGSITAAQFLHDRKLQVGESALGASESGSAENPARRSIAVATSSSLLENNTVLSLSGASCMSMLERKRLELELGAGGDHDVPYHFALPLSMPQVLAWMRLMGRVQRGEVEP